MSPKANKTKAGSPYYQKKKNLLHSDINKVTIYVFIKSQYSPCLPFSLRVLTSDINVGVGRS